MIPQWYLKEPSDTPLIFDIPKLTPVTLHGTPLISFGSKLNPFIPQWTPVIPDWLNPNGSKMNPNKPLWLTELFNF